MHIQLTSVLVITTGCRPPRQVTTTERDSLGDVLPSHPDPQQTDLDPRSSQATEDLVKAQLRAAKMKRSRAPNEPCLIPNKLLHRVDVSYLLFARLKRINNYSLCFYLMLFAFNVLTYFAYCLIFFYVQTTTLNYFEYNC
jgi:hypothetical protein